LSVLRLPVHSRNTVSERHIELALSSLIYFDLDQHIQDLIEVLSQ